MTESARYLKLLGFYLLMDCFAICEPGLQLRDANLHSPSALKLSSLFSPLTCHLVRRSHRILTPCRALPFDVSCSMEMLRNRRATLRARLNEVDKRLVNQKHFGKVIPGRTADTRERSPSEVVAIRDGDGSDDRMWASDDDTQEVMRSSMQSLEDVVFHLCSSCLGRCCGERWCNVIGSDLAVVCRNTHLHSVD